MPLLSFGREYAEIGPELLEAVATVFASQQFVSGPDVARFEAAAASRCQTKHAIGCGSGTDALWLAMAAAGVKPGNQVLTTPFSFFATVSAILRAGATPVLADIDPVSFNLSPEAASQTLARQPEIKAILPVHLYGQCADFKAFCAIKRESGCLLIEDAAQAFGAEWEGRAAGSLGDAAAFSFYPTKNLSAAGEAGMVTTDKDIVAERASMLRSHGMRRRYFHDEVGANSRLDTIQAAVLLVKLKYIDRWNEMRRTLAARYGELFTHASLAEKGVYPQHGVVLPKADPRAKHVFHQYVIRTPRRDALRAFLAERKIGSEVFYPVPLHLQAALLDLGYKQGDFPESERAAAEVLALPIFPQLHAGEQEQVVATVAEFLS